MVPRRFAGPGCGAPPRGAEGVLLVARGNSARPQERAKHPLPPQVLTERRYGRIQPKSPDGDPAPARMSVGEGRPAATPPAVERGGPVHARGEWVWVGPRELAAAPRAPRYSRRGSSLVVRPFPAPVALFYKKPPNARYRKEAYVLG